MGGTTVSVVIYLTATFAAGTPFRSTATAAYLRCEDLFKAVLKQGISTFVVVIIIIVLQDSVVAGNAYEGCNAKNFRAHDRADHYSLRVMRTSIGCLRDCASSG